MKTAKPHLVDTYNRHLNYLRISITDRCNLSCIYCKPDRCVPKLQHEDILTYEEILHLMGIVIPLGITKVRLTGGEPLVRKGVCDFLARLTALDGLKDVSLTTNGIFLKKKLERIKTAGIRRLNVSLDSLDRDKYREITGFDGFQDVWEGLDMARRMGFNPIKVNVVVMRGINDNELLDFARLTFKYPYHIRFIEYMPIGVSESDHFFRYVPTSLIQARLNSFHTLIPVPRDAQDGPSQRFRFGGSLGEIGFISPMSHHFCRTCNRLRLTASGQLRPCLLSNREIDIRGPLRAGASDHDLADIFREAALSKEAEHRLTPDQPLGKMSQMSSIGG
jgi:cyclic pyranopterin phosphate synthase